MKIEQVKTFEDLEQYLREFTNFSSDPVPYDFIGAFLLFRAILDNLARNSLEADIEELAEAKPCFSEDQLEFLRRLDCLR